MQNENEKAERLIPITDSVHAELSDMKGKKRITFSQLLAELIQVYKETKGGE